MKRRIEKSVYVFDSLGQPAEIYDSEKKASEKSKSVFDWVSSIMASFVVIFLIFAFGFRVVQVSGESMTNTLQHRDWLLVSNFEKHVQFGDIVVATPPTYKGGPVIKRVIGVAGDEIYIDFNKGEVYVNGKVLDEPYTKTPTTLSYDVEFPVRVPENCVFVMGDNRNGSLDSRSTQIGIINEKYILGRVLIRVFPFEKIEYINLRQEA
ncbi:MAG: signal peptidase I [Clostridia bacterium]|nr:signal peptidase I [Clostridia bacterium]